MTGRDHTRHQPKTSARRGIWAAAAIAAALAAPGSAAAALPDGRVYEQVSPVLKYGNDAGAPSGAWKYATATADGNGLFYGSRGPMGDANQGMQEYTVGRRGPDGWTSRSALPKSVAPRPFLVAHEPQSVVPSNDLTKLLFDAGGTFVPDNPDTGNESSSGALNLVQPDGSVVWLTRPQIPNPDPAPGAIARNFLQPVGGSPDLSTVYFWSSPTLLPEDAARASSRLTAWGLYEYSEGTLKAAGTLPDGTQDPGGAAPASTGGYYRESNNFTTPEEVGNQVSADGSTLLFVSPDPGIDPSSAPPTQLYIRRAGHSTLVSHAADKTPAPHGALAVQTLNGGIRDFTAHQFAFGSSDGMKLVFQSVDALAAGAPDDASPKSYRYDVATDTVTYLPDVSGAVPGAASTVVASSDDGSRFMFGFPISVWDNGTIKTIAPGSANQLAPARATASGSVFVFSTDASIGGNNSGGFVQVYRYDVAQDKTTCLSCPPNGVVPSGDATLANQTNPGGSAHTGELIASRGMSAGGGRVFFQSPDALVSRDGNGQQDVYEWTPSGVSLISSGRSQNPSFVLDISASGDDVFFATAEGLRAADTDGGYDVYDARVGGGFPMLDVAECAGDACQGAVGGSLSLPAPGSARFSGAGNQQPPASEPEPSVKLKLGSRKVAKSTLTVTVTIARPGRVTVSGNGLRSASRAYARAGTYKLSVSLSTAAKRTLKSRHRLKLSARVGFAPQSGAASSVTFVLNAKA
jgi:hypothetical protein